MSAATSLLILLVCVVSHLVTSGSACSQPGVLPHPNDCTQFLACLGSRETGFETETYQCPRGQAFSADESACVSRHLVSSCGGHLTRASDPECNDQMVSCYNCSTLVYCVLINGEYVNPTEVPCEKYCNSELNACVTDLPPGCDVPGFECTGLGYYPDPSDCTIYHICYNVEENLLESHKCPTTPKKYVYSSTKFICVEQVVSADCIVAKCPADYVGLIPYPKDTKYYVLCLSETEKKIFRCEGNLEFVESAHTCKFVCRTAGNFENTADCTKYHVCTPVCIFTVSGSLWNFKTLC